MTNIFPSTMIAQPTTQPLAWLGGKMRKNAFGKNSTKPGRAPEINEAMYLDEAVIDYREQKAKDEAKSTTDSPTER